MHSSRLNPVRKFYSTIGNYAAQLALSGSACTCRLAGASTLYGQLLRRAHGLQGEIGASTLTGDCLLVCGLHVQYLCSNFLRGSSRREERTPTNCDGLTAKAGDVPDTFQKSPCP